MPSNLLQHFIDNFLVDAQEKIYRNEGFTIQNDGEMLDGSEANEVFFGSAKSDIIWANAGEDTIFGGRARDLITGGAGGDLLFGGAGSDRLQGWDGNDQSYGGKGNDALFGGTGSDELYGGSGDDYLCAGSSRDTLFGGKGNDTFVFRPDLAAEHSESIYKDFVPGKDKLFIEDYLISGEFTKSMIMVKNDGSLYIDVLGGHQLSFETLDRADINRLFNSIDLI